MAIDVDAGIPEYKKASGVSGSLKSVGSDTLNNLMTFPCVNILAGRGKIKLHGAYFDVFSGALRIRNPETGDFHAAIDDVPGRVSLFHAEGA